MAWAYPNLTDVGGNQRRNLLKNILIEHYLLQQRKNTMADTLFCSKLDSHMHDFGIFLAGDLTTNIGSSFLQRFMQNTIEHPEAPENA